MDQRSQAEYWRFMNRAVCNTPLELFRVYVQEMSYDELVALLVNVDLTPLTTGIVLARIVQVAQTQDQQHQ
jgi:hypothetical protein